jgi:hypothetical protein
MAHCSHCKQTLEVPEDHLSGGLLCPFCNELIEITKACTERWPGTSSVDREVGQECSIAEAQRKYIYRNKSGLMLSIIFIAILILVAWRYLDFESKSRRDKDAMASLHNVKNLVYCNNILAKFAYRNSEKLKSDLIRSNDEYEFQKRNAVRYQFINLTNWHISDAQNTLRRAMGTCDFPNSTFFGLHQEISKLLEIHSRCAEVARRGRISPENLALFDEFEEKYASVCKAYPGPNDAHINTVIMENIGQEEVLLVNILSLQHKIGIETVNRVLKMYETELKKSRFDRSIGNGLAYVGEDLARMVPPSKDYATQPPTTDEKAQMLELVKLGVTKSNARNLSNAKLAFEVLLYKNSRSFDRSMSYKYDAMSNISEGDY